jgi:DNA topoisomerase-1
MSCAQKLFEGLNVGGEHVGLITYMRTDATDLAPEFLPVLESYVDATYGAGTFKKPKQGPKTKNMQEGHEALRVVDPALTPEKLETLLKNELLVKVYKLIWQRTIAAAMPEAQSAEITYTIQNNGHNFEFTTTQLLKPGFKVIYSGYNIEKEKDAIFAIGDVLNDAQLEDQAKQTTPPARYKEATLIKELQKREIGRPSTYVTIVETVLSPTRNYCVLEDKEIVPTEKGMQLASFLDRAFSNVISLNYTKQLEESLDSIASNKLDKLSFLTTFHTDLETALSANKETAGDIIGLETPQCPKCNGSMVIRRSRFGKLFYGCSNYPSCNGIIGID